MSESLVNGQRLAFLIHESGDGGIFLRISVLKVKGTFYSVFPPQSSLFCN